MQSRGNVRLPCEVAARGGGKVAAGLVRRAVAWPAGGAGGSLPAARSAATAGSACLSCLARAKFKTQKRNHPCVLRPRVFAGARSSWLLQGFPGPLLLPAPLITEIGYVLSDHRHGLRWPASAVVNSVPSMPAASSAAQNRRRSARTCGPQSAVYSAFSTSFLAFRYGGATIWQVW